MSGSKSKGVPPVLRSHQYSSSSKPQKLDFSSTLPKEDDDFLGNDGSNAGNKSASLPSWARKLGIGRVLGTLGSLSRLNPYQKFKNVEEATRRGRREMRAYADVREFSRPSDSREVMRRLKSNCGSFSLVYGAVYVFIFVYFLIMSPMMLVAVGLTSMSWTYLFLIKDGNTPLSVGGGLVLQRRDKVVVLSVVSALTVLFSGLVSTIFWVMFWGSCFNGSHAAMRRTVEIDPLEELEMESEQSGGGFANPVATGFGDEI